MSFRMPDGASTRGFAGVVAGTITLMIIDVVVGSRVFGEIRPALAADAVVAIAVLVAILSPDQLRLASLIGACLASIGISRAVQMSGPYALVPVMGSGAWPGFAEVAGLGFLTAWCVRSSSKPGVLVALGGLGTAFGAMILLRQNGHYNSELTILFGAAWGAFAIAGAYLRLLDHRQWELALRARHAERISIARELHDMVAHHVTGIVVQAQAARLVAADRPGAAAVALERIERAGAEALSAMRLMVGTLRDESTPVEVAPTASLDDLRALGDPPARGQLPVNIAIDGRADTLPDEVVASLHRIAREAVTNARRHARGATAIDVNVGFGNGHVQLLVINDGPEAGRSAGGFGLQGMAERAEALGGRFSAGPLPTGGWQVVAELPIDPAVAGSGSR
jgi:signal transduction histidine kinase